ncbi:hypothetical protein KM043_009443 [Ampulex compressa]|nr:hypothetical protein KM043_009443 [Ampulex compressa]
MMVISALKQVANAATNAVHSATSAATGHGNASSEQRYVGQDNDSCVGIFRSNFPKQSTAEEQSTARFLLVHD